MSLPFELPKYHKRKITFRWRNEYTPPLICTDEEIETIYDRYINSSQCELCNKVYKNSMDRKLDHCHQTGKFRNIVCNGCNLRKKDNKIYGKIDERYISIKFIKAKNYYQYTFELRRNNKPVVCKRNKDLDKLIKIRDEWIKNNPQYFS